MRAETPPAVELFATGGGASTVYAKPAFQAGPGVPADGARDIPDLALSSAGHDGYLIIQGHTATATGLAAVGGTSAASPSFAGLMALVVQKTGVHKAMPIRFCTPWGKTSSRVEQPCITTHSPATTAFPE